MENITKAKVLSSLIWKFVERIGTQGIQFIIQIVLARLLLPNDYGVIALIAVFIAVANIFVQSGFNTALIQKKDADELDFSSVLYLSLFMAIFLYTFLFFAAPFIAEFYVEPQLIPVLRVLSITLFFGALNSIQIAEVSRTMQFKQLFFSSLYAITASGIVGIVLAYLRYGVWALVMQQLTYQLIVILVLHFTVKWHLKMIISFERLKGLFSYGWKLLLSSLIDTTYNNVYSLAIGKVYNSETLGYFNRGDQFPNLIVVNINGSIQSVMLPALSANQNDKVRIKAMVRRTIVTSSFIIFPMMVGLVVIAEPLVKLLLTEKWLPCVPFLQLMCLSYAFWPIHTANLQAINAVGRSDIYLKLEIIKKLIGIVTLFVSIPFGILAIVMLKPILSIISTVINAFPNQKLLGYNFKEQWKDIMPSFVLSLVMGATVYCINFFNINIWIKLFIQISTGLTLYLGLSYLLKFECLHYLLGTMGEFIKRKSRGGTFLE